MSEHTPGPELYNYETKEYIRLATFEELLLSFDAATRDGGAGVITVDGVRCFAIGDIETAIRLVNSKRGKNE